MKHSDSQNLCKRLHHLNMPASLCVMTQQEQGHMHLQVLDEEMAKLREQKGDKRYFGGHFEEARGLFSRFSTSEELSDFLTVPAYEYVVDIPSQKTQSRM